MTAATEVRIALDVRGPLSYLALGPALALASEPGVQVDWLPFAGPALRPPTPPRPDDDRGVRHRRHRAHMIAREIAVYAEAQGLVLREPYREGPSDATRLAWLWVRSSDRAALPDFLRELFRRYWAVALDANDPRALAALLLDLGHERTAFEAWAGDEGPKEAARVAASLGAAGVGQAPAYLVEDELFYGRQHLPMIRWIAAGRSGPVPI